jgi:hypothetical protein
LGLECGSRVGRSCLYVLGLLELLLCAVTTHSEQKGGSQLWTRPRGEVQCRSLKVGTEQAVQMARMD